MSKFGFRPKKSFMQEFYLVDEETGKRVKGVLLVDMIKTVEVFLAFRYGVEVTISPPSNDRQLQLLGKAFDVASKDPLTMFKI